MGGGSVLNLVPLSDLVPGVLRNLDQSRQCKVVIIPYSCQDVCAVHMYSMDVCLLLAVTRYRICVIRTATYGHNVIDQCRLPVFLFDPDHARGLRALVFLAVFLATLVSFFLVATLSAFCSMATSALSAFRIRASVTLPNSL